MNIPKDSELRETVKAIKRISDLIQASNALMDNPQMDNGHVARPLEFLREMKDIRHSAYQGIGIIEALLNTPEGWPEKKVPMAICESNDKKWNYNAGTVDGYNHALLRCNLAAMKGYPCCGVARIVEKQAEAPTVEEIESMLWGRNSLGIKIYELLPSAIAQAVVELIKSKQKEKASGRQRKTTPEETIANYEKAKHSADNSTLVFNSKEQAQEVSVEDILETMESNWAIDAGENRTERFRVVARAVQERYKSKQRGKR